jgi:hypothetical protein
MGVREYDPALGRFVSADPLKGNPTEPQMRNRYQYTGNNPLVRYDINGMWWGGDLWGSVRDAAVGIWNDYEEGGVGVLWNDWQAGFGSMSTGQQVVLLGIPGAAAAAAVGVEAAGVGGTVIFGEAATGALSDELALEATELIERGGPECESVGIDFQLSEHAINRMAERGISLEEVESAFENAESFSYFHEGVWKTGYYDPVSKIFMGEINGTVTTVINNTSPQYIQNLKDLKP